MREIKFRAWHKAEKKMCDVTLLRPNHGAFLVGVAPANDEIVDLNGRTSVIVAPTDGRFCNWDEFELLQFTGLKDKNGKEIYEKDIVLDGKNTRVVDWFDEGAQFITMSSKDGLTCDESGEWDIMTSVECGGDYEIIGNIYENPELLK